MTARFRIFPPARSQYRPGRRAEPTGCQVVHTAETTPDFLPPDEAAENVAAFIGNRPGPGSYHELVDSDSIIQLVEFRDEALHDGTGSNRWSIGISAATFADSWDDAPAWWVTATIGNLAEAAARAHRWLLANSHPGTHPRRITRAESEAGESGFISHGERDPGRRFDPGEDFPWDDFLNVFAHLTGQRIGEPTTTKGAFMLKDFIANAYVKTRGYDPFRTGKDESGTYWWLDTTAAENPDSIWTWADCLASEALGTMVHILVNEQ